MAEARWIIFPKADVDNIIATVPKVRVSDIGSFNGRYGAFYQLVKSKLPPGFRWYPRTFEILDYGDIRLPIERIEQVFVEPWHYDILRFLGEVPAGWNGTNVVSKDATEAFDLACAKERAAKADVAL